MSEKAVDQGKGKAGAVLAALAIFACISAAAFLFCGYRIENEENAILGRWRDTQIARLENSLSSIAIWRGELENQAKIITAAEMFRIFIMDMRGLDTSGLVPKSADAPHVPGVRQRAYVNNLLQDFIESRAWNETRIVSPEGLNLVAPSSSGPLAEPEIALAEKACASGKTLFGPLKENRKGLFMEVADPLFEVPGITERKAIAALMLTVSMEKPLASFLADAGDPDVRPILVERNGEAQVMAIPSGSSVSVFPLSRPLAETALPFAKRAALAGNGMVYSLAADVADTGWVLVMETPAAVIDEEISSMRAGSWLVGIFASIMATLLAVFAKALVSSRAQVARAKQLTELYDRIEKQKLLLDGVNSSLHAGLLLADGGRRIRICNRAFLELADSDKETAHGKLVENILPSPAGGRIAAAMAHVMGTGSPETIEVPIPGTHGEKALWRVSVYPYRSHEDGGETERGCVATFQDITRFRAAAEKAAKRQEVLLAAMDRAMASADPHLVGQSEKMARVAGLLADAIGLDGTQKETVRLSAMLSQIGKLFVPRELLLKQGELTPEERREVGRAPIYADSILADLDFDLPVRETVREISERLDGSGPAGYTAEQISVCGRVLAVAAAFVAMVSPRAWRRSKAFYVEDAIEVLAKDRRFDETATRTLSRLDVNAILEALKGGAEQGRPGAGDAPAEA